MKTLIIGGGNMGLTYAKSILEARVVKAEDLHILQRSSERAFTLRQEGLGEIFLSPELCVPQADLVIIAVKPQDSAALFAQIKPFVSQGQVFMSVMAGVKMERIAAQLGVDKVVRAMPNLPSQIGMGMTAFTATQAVTRLELVTVQNLLNTTGKTLYLDDESMIDAATAVSGSGPAYVYYVMNALIEAAKELGFDDSQAELLVRETFMGAVHLENRSALSPTGWIAKVASKGGTTEAALSAFNEGHVHDNLVKGLKAAFQRAVDLGK